MQNNSPQQWFVQRKCPYKSQTAWRYLVYSLQTKQRANVYETPTQYKSRTQPLALRSSKRLTRPTGLHHCLLAAGGQTGAAAHYLLLSKIQRALSPPFSTRHHCPWLWRMHLLAKYSKRKKQIPTSPWLWKESECTRRWRTEKTNTKLLSFAVVRSSFPLLRVKFCFSSSAPPDLSPQFSSHSSSPYRTSAAAAATTTKQQLLLLLLLIQQLLLLLRLALHITSRQVLDMKELT